MTQQQPQQQPYEVVVIDDDPDVSVLIEVLVGLDERFVLGGIADSADRGIELARARQPDVIVLDLHLPGMDGFEAIPRLRAVTRCPIVVFSAFPDPYTLLEVVTSGADGYLNKASAWSELLPTMAGVCELLGAGTRHWR